MTTTRLASCLVGPLLAAVLVAPSAARAADAHIAFTPGDPSGVSAQIGGGLAGCATGCLALRVPARTVVAARREARLIFSPPPGTQIVQATLQLRLRTRQPGVSVRVLQRAGGRWVEAQRFRSRVARSQTVTTARGMVGVAVAIGTDQRLPRTAVRSDGDNMVSVDAIDMVVRDLSAPEATWIEEPPGATWLRGPVCGTAHGSDVGLGVDRLELRIGSALAVAGAPGGSRLQPRPPTFDARLCVDSTTLADGTYGTTLGVADGGPDTAALVAEVGDVRIDNTPPTVTFSPPADAEQRQPRLAFAISDAASGVASVRLTLDGVPVDARATATGYEATPAQALTDGTHVVAWTVVDNAGNVTADTGTFGVADVTPPSVELLEPLGVATAWSPIAVRVVDSGAGVAADGIRLAVDGYDVSAQLDVADGIARLTPVRPWAEGGHAVRVVATDRSGNRTVRDWTFTLPVTPTPPPVDPPVEPTPTAPQASVEASVTEDAAPVVETPQRAPLMTRALRLVAVRSRVRAGGTVVLRGFTGRPNGRRRAVIEARIAGRWQRVVQVPVDRRGRFSATVRLPVVGTYDVRARVGTATSSAVRLRAR